MPETDTNTFNILATESCRSALRLQNVLLLIFFIQIIGTLFDLTTLNLSVLFFQFSLFALGYLGAKRMSAPMLGSYVFLRSLVFIGNMVLLLVFIFAPDRCGVLQALTEASPPTEVFAAHVNTWSSSPLRVWGFIAFTFINMLYTTLVVMSMLLAWRLRIIVCATRAVLPIEVARIINEHHHHDAPVPAPEGYAPLPKDIEQATDAPQMPVPQVPFIPEGAYPPAAFVLYPALTPAVQNQ